jgi:hypothetical protein
MVKVLPATGEKEGETSQTQAMIFFVKAKPYPFSVHFIVAEQDLTIAKYVKRVIKKPLDLEDLETSYAITYHDINRDAVVSIKKAPLTPSEYGFFIHEVIHACMLIGEDIGMKKAEMAGETFTYLIQDIVVKALTKMQKAQLWPMPGA